MSETNIQVQFSTEAFKKSMNFLKELNEIKRGVLARERRHHFRIRTIMFRAELGKFYPGIYTSKE